MFYIVYAAAALLSTVVTSSLVVPVRQYVVAKRTLPIPPASLVTELNNYYLTNNTVLLANDHRTALVLIDVWDDHSDAPLYENQNLRLLPLLAYARSQKWLIIHAPSENQETPMIQVLPGELLVQGTDERPGSKSLCFPHLVNNSVTHVLIAGYDTNFCVLDKPCSTIHTSKMAEMKNTNTNINTNTNTNISTMEVLIVRDATLPQSQWFENDYYSNMASINMIEAASWLNNPKHQYIRSLTVTDLVLADTNVPHTSSIYINATTTLKYPIPQAAVSDQRKPAPVPAALTHINNRYNKNNPTSTATATATAAAALVVVSCGIDERGMYGNDGFRARVNENRNLFLEPLLQAARNRNRNSNQTNILHIIHVPNSHTINTPTNDACQPQQNEYVANTTDQFDAWRKQNNVSTLIYVGYAANRDMLFGVGGMQRYYSMNRYLHEATPDYYWISEATIALETPLTLAGNEWAKKQALAYRQPLVTTTGNILAWDEVMAVLKKTTTTSGQAIETTLLSSSVLPASEVAALVSLYHANGGASWSYNQGTDAVGGGRPWNVSSHNNHYTPCQDRWFGVECGNSIHDHDSIDTMHVLKLFVNTRQSGNRMTGELSPFIGNLTFLEHFYSSNDRTPSQLVGGIPASIGKLVHLKCMYFSHNNLTQPFPKELVQLTQLQVFLARSNHITGSLPPFAAMPLLRNVWFDGNELEGSLEELGELKQLTFLKADNNRLSGAVPESLCDLTCDASGNDVECPLVVKGCCLITRCGDKPGVPVNPPVHSMGECIPQ